MKYALLLILSIMGISCSQKQERQEITFWHFWSEPAQRAAIDSLVKEFEALHPTIHIVCSQLAWSDGKAKLQMAFNTGTQPDVVHLGMDWFAEFDRAALFAPIKVPTPYGDHGALWVTNARAWVTWDTNKTTEQWGLCANDNHNVLKRTLPLLWKAGARLFYTRLPISDDMDTSLVSALWFVRGLATHGIIDQGRVLDQKFLQREINSVYTGMWILDMAKAQHVHGFTVVPSASILNGDIVAVSKASNHGNDAQTFVAWLTAYNQAKRLCMQVSDAGIPADTAAYTDSDFRRTAEARGFIETLSLSIPLPTSPTQLQVEPVVEQLVEQCYRATSKEQVALYVREARSKIQQIEALP